VLLRRTANPYFEGAEFDPTGQWLATAHVDATAIWSLTGKRPYILRADDRSHVESVAFTPDGRTLVAAGGGDVRAWSLGRDATEPNRVLLRAPLVFPGVAIDPAGLQAAVAGGLGRVVLLPIRGGPPRELVGFSENAQLQGIVFADEGRLVAAVPYRSPRDEKVIRVWNLASGAVRSFGPVPGAKEGFDGRIMLRGIGPHHVVASVGGFGLVRYDLRTGSHDVLTTRLDMLRASSTNGRSLLACLFDEANETCPLVRVDLQDGVQTPLATHGNGSSAAAFDPSGMLIATGSFDGTVRVGRATGDEPHVFLGLGGHVRAVAFSPDGRWLASAGEGGEIRLWQVSDVATAPLHVRPHTELMAALRSHTNLRAIGEPSDPGSYKLESGPFPGWAKPPVW
jgi:WD40 repeat protein